ncbi:uncharacterized protein si:dkey-172o19.2 [Esox lucius]|uniref:uncharacterized protein si:dkey-172o19.2 n=1 Tax=Esox lucius TaxID=8010 RepID=UPI001477410C|nr:uncharacterized protein si:dkey-172o19.2 [Esox lucius]
MTDMSAPQSSHGTPDDMCRSSASSLLESNGGEEEALDRGLIFPVARSCLLANRILKLRTCPNYMSLKTRRKREMTPVEKKDANYWDKRRKNNEAAKRSREKRRVNDLMLESQLLAISEENTMLRAEVLSLQYHIGLGKEAGQATRPFHGPAPLHYPIKPTLFHPGVGGHPISLLGDQHHLEGLYLRTRVQPTSKTSVGILGVDQCSPQNFWNSGLSHYVPPSCNSQRTACASESSGSVEQEEFAHQVSSSHDLPSGLEAAPASNRAFLTAFHTLPSSPILPTSSCPPQSWLLPSLNPMQAHTNRLLPCSSPHLPQAALYPSRPLYLPLEDSAREHQPLDIHRDYRDRFNRLGQLRRYLSRDSS